MLCKSMLDLDITYSRGFFCDHLATASAAAVVLYGIRSVGRVVTIADHHLSCPVVVISSRRCRRRRLKG